MNVAVQEARKPLSWKKKFVFACVMAVGLPILLELASRVLFGWNRHWLDCHRPHASLGWCLREGWSGKWSWTGGYSHINAQGIRDDEDIGPKASHEKRLLIVGDSVTFGANVKTNETYPKQIQQSLPSHQRHWRILNGGVTAYDSSQEAEWLEEFGWPLQPDALFVAFCRNDTCASPRKASPVNSKVSQWLSEHSLLYFKLERIYGRARAAWNGPAGEITSLVDPKASMEGWPMVEQAYRQIAASAKAKGVPVAILIWPTMDYLSGKQPDDLTSKLNGLAAELGWQVIDLEPAFKPCDAKMFLAGDPVHPSAYGFAKATEHIMHELPRIQWLQGTEISRR